MKSGRIEEMDMTRPPAGAQTGTGGALRAVAAAALLALGTCLAGAVGAQTLDELIAGAKAEGEVSWYTGATENVAIQVGAAFEAKYGVPVRIVRLSSNNIMQRYATEAEAGTVAADLIIAGGSAQAFAENGIARGWIEPIADAGLPVITDGTFPAQFNRGTTALAMIQPWVIVYNSQLMTREEAPTQWEQVFEDRFRGQILLPNPGVSDAYTEFWYLLRETYGPEFLTRVAQMEPRRYDAGVQGLQALGAGEGLILVPLTGPAVAGLKATGAPVDFVTPDVTTGVELQLILTDKDVAPNPNAGRLLANFLLSEEGNAILNQETGAISVYDNTSFPAAYKAPDPAAGQFKAEIAAQLGF
jgi:iron(III) transport system substrate-binding protein